MVDAGETALSDVLFERNGRVATVILNAPERLNALSNSMMKKIGDAMQEYEADDSVHVVVFRGAGRALCSGSEVVEIADLYHEVGAHTDRRELNKLAMWFQRNIWEFSKPTILEVKGYCYGGANLFLAFCDLVVAADDALMGPNENRGMALDPSMALWTLTMGIRRTKALFLTGDTIDGKKAEEYGLVNKSVPADELETYVDWLAQKIAKTDLSLLSLLKQGANMVYDVMGAYPMFKANVMFDHMAHMDSKFGETLHRVKRDGPRAAFNWVYGENDDPTFLEGPPKKKAD
nr:enoyl-CoA hydratase/isomerase family protein [Sphingomonas sp. Y57]